MTIELNVRLDTKTGVNDDVHLNRRMQIAIAYLSQFGNVLHHRVALSPAPAHLLILGVSADDIPNDALFELSVALLQDCLSVFYPSRGAGELIGPTVAEYGDFQLAKFYRLDPTLSSVTFWRSKAPSDRSDEDVILEASQTHTSIEELDVVFLDVPVPQEFILAAASVPSDLGYDREENETYLTGKVLEIKWVSDESTQQFLQVELDDACEFPATMLRVDYEAWALPGDFDAAAPDRVIYRREHIYVRAGLLKEQAVYAYGMGPEYGFDHWEQDIFSQGTTKEEALPKDTLLLLADEIESNFASEIEEYVEESPIPKGMPRPLLGLYRKLLAATQAKAAAYVQQQRVICNEISGELIALSPRVVGNEVHDGIRRLYVDSKSGHFRFVLQFPEDFVVGQPVAVKVTKAERVLSARQYRTLSEKEIVCPIALRRRDITGQFEKLALIGWPASEFAGESMAA